MQVEDLLDAVGATRVILVAVFQLVLLKVALEFWVALWVEVVLDGEDLLNGSKSQVRYLTELGSVLVHGFLSDLHLGDKWTVPLDVRLVK